MVAGWDGVLRVYAIELGGYVPGFKESFNLELGEPVITMALTSTFAFLGLGNGLICAVELNTKGLSVQGRHEGPVTFLAYSDQLQVLISGSTDKKVHFWQLGNPHPVNTVTLTERVLAGDLKRNLLVLGLSNENVLIWNLETQFKNDMTRCPLSAYSVITNVGISHQATTLIFGAIDGRISICGVARKELGFGIDSKVVFKASKTETQSYSKTETCYTINASHFNPYNENEFVVGGGHGKLSFWDANSRGHLRHY